MDFLINPNVAYVLLIFGFLTMILALFSPGTGILELVALFALVVAGYGIANMPINWWALAILALGFIPFLMSLMRRDRSRLFLLLGSAIAFLIGSAFLFRGENWQPAVNPLLVLLLSPITIGITWLLANKMLEAVSARPSFDLDRLVGMMGLASSDIRGQGTVYVNGEEWTAISQSFIPAGSAVRIVRRNGLTLEVEDARS
jgi:membrane-bound serine protease (ClpP class)